MIILNDPLKTTILLFLELIQKSIILHLLLSFFHTVISISAVLLGFSLRC